MLTVRPSFYLVILCAATLVACGKSEAPAVPPATSSTQPAGEVAPQPAVASPPDVQVKAEEQHVAKVADSAVKKKSADAVSAGDKMAAKAADTAEVATTKVAAAPAPSPSPSPVAKSGDGATQAVVGMPDSARKNGCTACHAIDKKMIGPSWTDVAKKYKGVQEFAYSAKGSAAPDATKHPLVEGLMLKVSKGGAGNWGTVAMIANDPSGKKQDQIKELVEFVLGLAN